MAVLALAMIALLAGAGGGLFSLAAIGVSDRWIDAASPSGASRGRYRRLQIAKLSLTLLSAMAAGTASVWWVRPSLEAAGLLLVTALLLFTVIEALPRTAGFIAPELARTAGEIMDRWLWAFAPLTNGLEAVERALERTLGMPKPRPGNDREMQDMALGAASLAETTVEEVMTPRRDIHAVERDVTRGQVLDAFRRGEHSRLIVYDESLDNIVGVVHARDLFPGLLEGGDGGADRPWLDLVRAPTFVPEVKTLDEQIRDFQRGHVDLAIVVDEYGGTAGLITQEDVLEVIVGEIWDEYDDEEAEVPVLREGDDRVWVHGSVTLDELSEALGERFSDDEVATVGGLVLATLGRVPVPGEEFAYGGYRVVVEKVKERRVLRVYFERRPPPSAEPSTEAPQ